MKEVLELIQEKKEEYAQSPWFDFLRDSSIDPRQRAAWFPCFMPFVMCFKDINAFSLREEPATSPIQEMINKHTYEDGRHWAWALADIEALGINHSMRFTDVLKFLWGQETENTRKFCYDLFALCHHEKDPIIKLAAIESIEATGTVALAIIAQLGRELEQLTHKKFRYLSASHLAVETGHIQSGVSYEETDEFLHSLQLTEEQKTKACEVVEIIFEGFIKCTHELLAYAEKYPIDQPFPKMFSAKKIVQKVA